MNMMAKSQWAAVKYSITKLGGGMTQAGVSYPGGLDLTTPSLALQPGALRDCLNFECSPTGGYSRIQGYERYSGQFSPSSAAYGIIQVSAFVNVPSTGQVISQASSGASGTIVAVVNGTTTYVAVTQISGTFDSSGVLTTPGPVTVGTAVMTTVAVTSQQDAQYLAAAADVYRALIGAVPGSGAILGVVAMAFSGVDSVFAFRADALGTTVNIYKSSASGWVQVPLLKTVGFNNGGSAPSGDLTVVAGDTVQINGSLNVTGTLTVQGTLIVDGPPTGPKDGDTLRQGSVTATISRVVWQSGTWAAGSAAGNFVISNLTGGSFTAGQATTSSGTVVYLTGAETQISLAIGGRFEFVKSNFSGQSSTRRIYGCDGVNTCFEFDGTILAPIATGASPDSPTHIWSHKNFLFVSVQSSLLYCGADTPFKWGALDGGGEIATGDVVTGMITLPGSQSTATLGVYLRDNTAFLYGTAPDNFNFVTFNTGQGAVPYSLQNLSDTFVFDNLGVITLKTTLNWGNFLPTTLTKNIMPFVLQERTKLSASAIQRAKSQYRVFFKDGFGLWLTMINQQYLGAGVVLFPNPVFVCDYEITTDGTEVSYFGSNDGLGFIYQMDQGTSFDGANIDAHATMAWDAIKSPRILKRFRAASIEIQGNGYANVQFGYQLGYGSQNIGQPAGVNYATGFRPAPVWDQFIWDNFFWDGQTLLPTDVDVTGTAENIQVTLTSTTNYIPAFTLNSIIHHYSMRRGLRV